jgi:hypothetical protein
MRKLSFAFLSIMVIIYSCQKSDNVNDEASVDSSIEEQGGRRCAADEVLQQQIAEDPSRAAFLNELELKTQAYKGSALEAARSAGILYVPVVVHVVLQNTALVTDDQIRSQIDVLNKDFTKTNSELSNTSVYLAGYNYNNVANCEIKYVVTNIVRKTTTVTSFGTNDAVKKTSQGGSDPVDPTTKLNMWVCDLSSGYLGYAQFPGGSAATDGVVIDYQAFGTFASYPMYAAFNLGRTATHEVGHWVNLRHIWGDRRCGDDYVSDTPAHDASNGGCPGENHLSKCAGRPKEQWMNYMDYTDDKCMYMFSGGQKTRMDVAIDNARKAYFFSTSPISVL